MEEAIRKDPTVNFTIITGRKELFTHFSKSFDINTFKSCFSWIYKAFDYEGSTEQGQKYVRIMLSCSINSSLCEVEYNLTLQL
jgi:hypothetical protein